MDQPFHLRIVAGVDAHVGDHHRLPRGKGGAGDGCVDRHGDVVELVGETADHDKAQGIGILPVRQQDAGRLAAGQLGGRGHDLMQQGFQRHRGGQLAADLQDAFHPLQSGLEVDHLCSHSQT